MAAMNAETNGIPSAGVRHLLLWLTTVAFCLVGVRYSLIHTTYADSVAVPEFSRTPWIAVTFWMFIIVSAIVRGAAIAGAIIVVRAHFSNTQAVTWHPGHLLLLVLGVDSMVAGVADMTMICYFSAPFLRLVAAVGHGAMSWVITPSFFIYCAWKRSERPWKVYFISASVVTVFPGLVMIMYPVTGPIRAHGILIALHACLNIGLVAVAIIDRIGSEKRDWLHWTGIIVAIVLDGIAILWSL